MCTRTHSNPPIQPCLSPIVFLTSWLSSSVPLKGGTDVGVSAFFQSCSCACCPYGETIALSEINSFVEWVSYRIPQTRGKTRKMILRLMICVAVLQVKNWFSVPKTAYLSRNRKVVANNTRLTRKQADGTRQ